MGKPKQRSQVFDQNTSIVNRFGNGSVRVLRKPPALDRYLFKNTNKSMLDVFVGLKGKA